MGFFGFGGKNKARRKPIIARTGRDRTKRRGFDGHFLLEACDARVIVCSPPLSGWLFNESERRPPLIVYIGLASTVTRDLSRKLAGCLQIA